uniref:Glycosyltransferase family 1 protein n=1 Tax=Dictyoglomus turgidum TaxID=513050 RepID=A0A7C3SQJ2_9BACT
MISTEELLIIHVLPENTSPCGGIKVHYDLSEIEKKLGIESIICFPNVNSIPHWMAKRDTGRITSYKEAQQYAYTSKKSGKKVVVIGWEDTYPLDSMFNDFIKVCYIQGHVFWNPILNNYRDKHILCISEFVRKFILREDAHVVEPFIRKDIFYPMNFNLKFFANRCNVLIQKRKNGDKVREDLINILYSSNKYSPTLLRRVQFYTLEDVSEIAFAHVLREHDVFIAHSYPEGFGLPALEAMASNTFVIGFTGGGGEEFMKDGQNCFVVKDGDLNALADSLYNFLLLDNQKLEVLIRNAYNTSLKYTKENTTQQYLRFLERVVG